MPATTSKLRLRFVAEADLSANDHAVISALLVSAFPEYAGTFCAASWYGGRPDHRLWLKRRMAPWWPISISSAES